MGHDGSGVFLDCVRPCHDECCFTHQHSHRSWKDGNSSSLVTIENKHIHAMDTSEVSLMGEMLGRVEINDGVTKYFGADGQEVTLPQPTIGIALEFFPGTTYVDTLGLDGNPTIRTYTQVTDVENGLPLGSVVGTAEIVTSTHPHDDRDVIHVATSFKDMTGRHVGNEISQTYADTGEPTGVTGQSRWTVIEKYESDGVTLNPKWVAMEAEFSWIALDPAMTSVLLHTNTYTGWKLNEDGTYSLSTMENKHIHAMDTSEVSLMGEMLGRVEINDGVTKYFGANGRELTLPDIDDGGSKGSDLLTSSDFKHVFSLEGKNHNLELLALEGGSVWVTWSAFGVDGYQSGAQGQIIDFSNLSKFEPLLLNSNNTMGYQMSGPSAYLPNGQIISSWNGEVRYNRDDDGVLISVDKDNQIISSTVLTEPSEIVIGSNDGVYNIITTNDDVILVVGDTANGHYLSSFKSDLTYINTVKMSGGGHQDAVLLDNGNIAYAYTTWTGTEYRIIGEILNFNGDLYSDTTKLNSFRPSIINQFSEQNIRLKATPDGEFTMLWQEYNSKYNSNSVSTKIQKFNQYGDAVGDPLVVNSDTRNSEFVIAKDGTVYVTWEKLFDTGEIDSYGSPILDGEILFKN